MVNRRRGWTAFVVACLATGASCENRNGDDRLPEPPATKRSEIVRTWHGHKVAEPYAWLEAMESESVLEWARAQDGYARRLLPDDAVAALRRDIQAVAGVTRFVPPVQRGDRYFYVTFDAAAAHASAWIQIGLANDPEKVLDAAALLERREVLHRQIWPSPDGRYFAYGVTAPGSRWMELRFRDLRSGEDLPDRLTGLVAFSSTVSWAADASGVYYERFELPPVEERLQAPLHDENVLQHALGTPQSTDTIIFDSRDPDNHVIGQTLSDDGRFLVVTVRDGRESSNRVLALDTMDPAAQDFRDLAPGVEGNFAFVGSRGDEIWLQTDLDAPRGRVVGVRWGRPPRTEWREIVPERNDATIDTWVGARGIGDGMVIGYRKDSRLYFDYFDEGGKRLRRFEPPNLGSVWTGFYGRQDVEAVFFNVSSFADPGTVYRMDLASGEESVFRRPELPYDPDQIVVEQRFYRSAARERVPMFVAYHKSTPPDGTRPVMMYGYGFGGWIAAPWFRPHLPAWFDSGGTFVLPALRGGGEYGEEWHQAGARTNKTNAIDDYIAAAQSLVEAGLARPSRLVAETNSAGGPVVGAAIVRRPDLFGAAILAFPLLDLLGYENYTHAGRWRSELGSVENADEFASLLSYSPVHNVVPGACYPPVLLAPGALDEITPPMHAYKFAATLQHARGCGNPVLMRVSRDAGHAYGGTPEETAASLAAQLIFLQIFLDESD